MKTSCFWTDDYPRPAALPAGDLPNRTDVLVIGGGITGLTAARRLARAGIETVVTEALQFGDGASARNGGMAIYGLKAAPDVVIKRFGDRLGRELWDASNVAIDRIEETITEEAISCDFTRPGSAELGFTRRDDRVLAAYAAWATKDLGFPIEYVPRDRLGEVIGSPRFSMALIENVSAGLHPAKYTFGLARGRFPSRGRFGRECRSDRRRETGRETSPFRRRGVTSGPVESSSRPTVTPGPSSLRSDAGSSRSGATRS